MSDEVVVSLKRSGVEMSVSVIREDNRRVGSQGNLPAMASNVQKIRFVNRYVSRRRIQVLTSFMDNDERDLAFYAQDPSAWSADVHLRRKDRGHRSPRAKRSKLLGHWVECTRHNDHGLICEIEVTSPLTDEFIESDTLPYHFNCFD